MTQFYEASTSGLNFDRFTDELFGESTKLRMKQTFWTAKQLLREKLGRREDEHLMAADADLDMKLQQFQRIRESTKQLLETMGQMQRESVNLAKYELDLADLLCSDCQGEKEHLQRVMQMMANSEAFSAKERQILLRSIVHFYHELDDFYERAILDCEQTVEAVEKVRLEYRGSLLWMKNSSEALDPERKDSNNLEDFRAVQNVVKGNKMRLDRLKEDVSQKVDFLQKARSKMFEQCLAEYKTALLAFFEATSIELSACAEEMAGLESYEIDVLKILNDPIGVALEKHKEGEEKQQQQKSRQNIQRREMERTRRRLESENDESLVELEDLEVAEVCEPEMDRVRELLRFDEEEMEGNYVGRPMEFDGNLWEEEIDLMKPTPSTGLNLLKHSNEIDEFGQLMGIRAREEKQQKERFDGKRGMDLLWELEMGLDEIGGTKSKSPLTFFGQQTNEVEATKANANFEAIFQQFGPPSQNGGEIPKLAPPPQNSQKAQKRFRNEH